MKSRFLLFIALAFSLSTFAQITIKSTDFTVKVGDTLKVRPVTKASLATIPAFKTGGNQTWDFSKLSFENFYYYDPILKANNPSYPTASFAITSSASLGAIVIPTIRYFEKSASSYKDLGFTNIYLKQSLQNVTGSNKDTLYLPNTEIKYTDTWFSFPMSFGGNKSDKWVQNRPYVLSVAAFGLSKTPGNVKTTIVANKSVAAWGKIILPDFKNKGKSVTYSTIVQINQTTAVDSVFLAGAPAPAALLQAFGLSQGQQGGYSYFEAFIPGFKTYAVQGELNQNLNATNLFVSLESGFIPGESVGLKDVAEQIETEVFPNPSKNGEFNLRFEKATSKDWSVKIYDISGRQIAQNVVMGEGEINHQLSIKEGAGTYFYALFNENQQFITNGTLLIN